MNDKAIKMLKQWIDYSVNDLYAFPDRPELLCYGTGYNGWGIQTHQKALAAFAVMATNKGVDYSGMKTSKAQALEYSLKMLRYMLESHIEGSYECSCGDKWGHTWISVLGTERVMHAVEELMPYMTEDDKILLEKVLISEADWLLDCYDVCAHPDASSGKNKPESNIWNGAFLHRVTAMYPQCKSALEYKEKATSFLVNGISVSEDEKSDIIYDGKPVSEWYVGNNFYNSYALDHHTYLNVGYMVICISNIAMYHFTCKKLGICAPDALYHHAKDLWRLIKMFIADDGRLIRVGGDSRVRYCYCQDYLLPSLMFARDVLKDKDAEELEHRLVDLFYKEFSSNGDGSFLSERCAGFRQISPLYYTRLESDKAVVLSMLINWNDIAEKGSDDIPALKSWHAPSHGACAVRSENRFVSWSFKGCDVMMGLCLPAGESDLAEWHNNLAADISGTGVVNQTKVISKEETVFDGGFLVSGEVKRVTEVFIAEQQKRETLAIEHIAFAALPDDMTTIVIQYASTPKRVYLSAVKGINYNVPNDVYNDFKRTYHYEKGELKAEHFAGDETITDLESKWVNIDGRLGIIAGYDKQNMKLYRPGKRQTGIKKRKQYDNLHHSYTEHLSCDIICTNVDNGLRWVDKNEVILDTSAIILAGSSKEDTRMKSSARQDHIKIINTEFTRSVIARGNDGADYILISNPSEQEQAVRIEAKGVITNAASGESQGECLNISPKDAVLLKVTV